MTSKKIKFAVVGYGHIGKRHAEMINRNSGAELVAIIDTVKEQVAKEALEEALYFDNLDVYLSTNPEVDVINICTPNGYHAEHALKALKAHKHVVVEKPMALTCSDAEKLIFEAFKVHRHLFAVMQNRYSPPSVWIKELVDSGKLGQIYIVQLNCYWNRDERYYKPGSWHGTKNLDGGTLFTQFSHFVDIMYWLFGDIHNITSRIRDFNHNSTTEFEDSGFITFDFLNGGGMGAINFSTAVWNANMESSMTIIGEFGSVKIGGQYMDRVEICNIKNYTLPELAPTNPGNDYGAYKGSAQNHNYVIDNVVNVLNGVDTITTNALEGMKVVDIIERIYRAASNT